MSSASPIIIVTGANTGLGLGICHRIIFQLTNGQRATVSNELELNCDGLTLILACRNKQRAEAAQAKLFDIADKEVHRAKRSPNYDGHAERFRKDLRIVIHIVDLADVQSVFRFADEVNESYPYVSHLICNAGVACFTEIVWSLAIVELLTNFVRAVTTPTYYRQRVGDLSQDRLGWVWQCNVFGHYALYRALEPLLVKYTAATGARVVWISSHEASSKFYDPQDWQLVKTEHSYECSKYQMNMLALHLDQDAINSQIHGIPAVRHLIAYPGVVGTNIANAILGTFSTYCMFATFYIARFLGSTNHPIDIFKAAISAVHLTFASIACLSTVRESPTNLTGSVEVGAAYASKTDRWGREYIGTIQLSQTKEEQEQPKELLENFDRLLKTFCEVQGRPSPSG